MRLPLIALIPAAMLASAAYAQSADEAQPQTEPPTAEQTAEPEAADTDAAASAADAEQGGDDEEEAPPPPEVVTSEVTGTWERSTSGGRDTATYTTAEGETVFSATCMTADTETGNKIMQIKAASAEDTVGAIDLFTSAGNARVPAAPDMEPDTAAGMAEPVSQQTYVLASGAGDIRVVSGSRGLVFETDPMLKEVVRGCHPEPGAAVAASVDADDEAAETAVDAEEEPAEEAATNS